MGAAVTGAVPDKVLDGPLGLQGDDVLRVLAYNVRSLRDDHRLVYSVIRSCGADVVCIQEAPRLPGWQLWCRRLAAATGLKIVTGGRPAAAMLILARPDLTVQERRNVLLTPAPRLHRRGLASARFVTGVGTVTITSMHLDLDPGWRRLHAAETLAALEDIPGPHILAGDVNELAGAPAWTLFARRLTDAYAVAPVGDGLTFPARRPQRRIDGIFVDAGLDVVACGVPQLPRLAEASDHLPLLAVLRRRPDDADADEGRRRRGPGSSYSWPADT
ncbi:MAG: endonuclease/exonuclease/phosphatase family protein [Actinomycetota bacterium]|nr:endonuclease/exonuclease/phosphatase family protein [Actinomycetota bacterium]